MRTPDLPGAIASRLPPPSQVSLSGGEGQSSHASETPRSPCLLPLRADGVRAAAIALPDVPQDQTELLARDTLTAAEPEIMSMIAASG